MRDKAGDKPRMQAVAVTNPRTKGTMSKGTTVRTFRVPDPRWMAAKTRADDEGRTLTEIVNDALEEYGTRQQ